MATTLEAATFDTLDKLADCEAHVWSAAEIALYLQDGHDEFTRRTKCLFDMHVIENIPPSGNWQTDLERYHAQQRSGWGLTDEPMNMSAEHERDFGVGGGVGGSYAQIPAASTTPSDPLASSTTVPGGTLPSTTVEVLRVTYDDRALLGLGSQEARVIDPNYMNRSGDPQFFTFDKDGINFLRLIPQATGTAVYDTISGSWGTRTYTDDTDCTPVLTEVTGSTTGGFGILRHVAGDFPAGGPWGTPTRRHPSTANIRVDLTRLGRTWASHPSELPVAYQKYVIFWAMAQALRRDGPGQSLELAQHFFERFEMGVYRLTHRVNLMTPERPARLGQPTGIVNFGLGMPTAPYPFGEPR